MLGVNIHINGTTIFARTAVNQGWQDEKGRTAYKCDDGSMIFHRPEDGAVKLAKSLLGTIKEQKP